MCVWGGGGAEKILMLGIDDQSREGGGELFIIYGKFSHTLTKYQHKVSQTSSVSVNKDFLFVKFQHNTPS